MKMIANAIIVSCTGPAIPLTLEGSSGLLGIVTMPFEAAHELCSFLLLASVMKGADPTTIWIESRWRGQPIERLKLEPGVDKESGKRTWLPTVEWKDETVLDAAEAAVPRERLN